MTIERKDRVRRIVQLALVGLWLWVLVMLMAEVAFQRGLLTADHRISFASSLDSHVERPKIRGDMLVPILGAALFGFASRSWYGRHFGGTNWRLEATGCGGAALLSIGLIVFVALSAATGPFQVLLRFGRHTPELLYVFASALLAIAAFRIPKREDKGST